MAAPTPAALSGPPAPAPAAVPAPARAVPPPPQADWAHMEGKPIYTTLCAPCHGADAKGYAADHAPSLVNPTFLESATDDFLRKSIIHGRPGTSMAAYGSMMGGPLDNAAVDRVVAHLRSGGPKAKTLAGGPPGDPDRGGPLYLAHCRNCHGDSKTRGEAIFLVGSVFVQQASDPFLRHAIIYGRPGTKMESFSKKLSDQETSDVIAHIRKQGGGEPNVELLPEPTGKEPLLINPKGKDPTFTLREDRFVGVEQVNRELKAKRKMVIIDARPPSEWRRVRIKGAVSIPYHDMKRLADVPKDVWAIAYCACPHHLSGDVVNELKRLGHTRALVLDEGINEWHRRGYPITAAKGVAIPAAEPPHAHVH